MKKSMTRSDLASEAVRRPKQPQKNLLEKIRMVSQSSVNEFQEVISIFFCQRVSGGYLNLLSLSLKAKYPKETAPPMAAAGLLGPDLVYETSTSFECVSLHVVLLSSTMHIGHTAIGYKAISVLMPIFGGPIC